MQKKIKSKKKEKKAKHILQWYWQRNWLNKKCEAWYFGPRLDWMNKA
tara:strand:- start:645 stop:785 length:141 start_codon:yes stop_codon:yes gene_type:complete